MPRKSVEARLQSLQDKRDALAAEIKKMQAEKAQQLRKRQRQREAIVGRVIYQLIESRTEFNAGPWSEEDLLAVMGTHLTRQRDRQLFGLPPVANQETRKANKKKPAKLASESAANSNSKSVTKSTAKKGGKLAESSSQDDLMGEFNL